VNLLPLCQSRQALLGAAAPARRFERILDRMVCRVNESREEKRNRRQDVPNMVQFDQRWGRETQLLRVRSANQPTFVEPSE